AMLVLGVVRFQRLVTDPRHREAERIIPTFPFLSRTLFLGRSDNWIFKELLRPSKIAVFFFQLKEKSSFREPVPRRGFEPAHG
ncbi:hypothetical protein, partial [Puia sp.]|uniref:hypothetical protein n=1 Tax=Puia sp. TaxID=2045100 RepID=UPI002F3E2DA2